MSADSQSLRVGKGLIQSRLGKKFCETRTVCAPAPLCYFGPAEPGRGSALGLTDAGRATPRKEHGMRIDHMDAMKRGWKPVLVLAMAWTLAGCGGIGPRGGGDAEPGPEESAQVSQSREEAPASSKRFEEPGELDKLLDAKPIALAVVKPASQSTPAGAGPSKAAEPMSKGKGNFRIQVGAENRHRRGPGQEAGIRAAAGRHGGRGLRRAVLQAALGLFRYQAGRRRQDPGDHRAQNPGLRGQAVDPGRVTPQRYRPRPGTPPPHCRS